ncbi:integrator complex subunit 6-like isoform X2 [Lissotriton helveticus]
MPIILFLIDSSASMNQRTYLGTSYLDIAKGAVEIFMKLRARDPSSRGDRYMLVTFDDAPYGIKAGWKENHATFMDELKNLQASGLTTLGQALRSSFDLLNVNRLVSGIDNYGQGRNPFFLEPSILITITDGNKLTSSAGVQEELHLPLNSPLPGSELTKEPFRWDQRLFALVLRLPGASSVESEQLGSVPMDESAITQMCEVTGGRSYCVRTQRMLNQCLESLAQKVQSGVVINFEKTGPDPSSTAEDGMTDSSTIPSSCSPQPWHSCHKLIYVRPNPKTGVPLGHWPVPESFWPDQNSPSLPPRTSHPVVKFACIDTEPMVIDKLPFDKYELEPSPLTQFILERKSPHVCWQVFVTSSGKYSEVGHPFGYLKASTTLTCVNLFVMPYNFPVLLPLLDDLFKVHKLKPDVKWRRAFDCYLKTIPPYFLLTKLESERILASVGRKVPFEAGIKVKNNAVGRSITCRSNFKQFLQDIVGEAPLRLAERNPEEFSGFKMGLLNKDLKPQVYRNAYDIPRQNLLDQLTRMRSNLLKTHRPITGQDEDYLHSVPVSQMGNYQEYLKMMPSPLREIDPDQPKRLNTFGNPFKQDKKGMMIDEADEFVAGPQNKNKRLGEPNSPASVKRRRSLSPLLRIPQSPPVINNIGAAFGAPSPCTVIKPVPLCRDSRRDDEKEDEGGQSLQLEMGALCPQDTHTFAVPDGVAANATDFLPGESSCSREDILDCNLNNNGLEGGPLESCNVLVDYHEMEGQIASGTAVPNSLQVTASVDDGTNACIKIKVMKEVRKPGRSYEKIFSLLENIQGPLDVQRRFIEFTVKEAARFKKRFLIQHLERVLLELETIV